MNQTELNERPVLLLADDDEVFRDVLAKALRRRGYAVETAGSAEDALALSRNISPEFAVVDLKMPGDSGLKLIADLIAIDPNTRIVMLTGYASIATAVESIKLGATHYLTKPANADEIIAALSRAEGDAGTPVAEAPLSVNRLEWEHIQAVLTRHDGNISAAARALAMHRRTLQRKLAKRPARV
jgi:two-component system, response regulator RegA